MIRLITRGRNLHNTKNQGGLQKSHRQGFVFLRELKLSTARRNNKKKNGRLVEGELAQIAQISDIISYGYLGAIPKRGPGLRGVKVVNLRNPKKLN